jgi:hypothetical protein
VVGSACNAKPKKKGYLTIDRSTALAFDRSAYRIMDLAEILFNLQYVQGFDECISRMREGDIDGTHAELDLGRMLFLNRIRFRYIIPTGVKGHTTQRIVSVKYYTSAIVYIDGTLKFHHVGKEVSNQVTDFGCFLNWSIFHLGDAAHPDWAGGLPPWWQRIMFYPDGKVR